MSRKSRRSAGTVVLGLIVALIATACGGGTSSSAGSSEVKWAFSLPTSWDPVTSRTGNDINTISLAYASLTRVDKDGNVEPSLAQSWQYDDTGTAVTFTLRDGLTFTDGTALDATAVKSFFDRGKTQEDSFLKDQLAGVTDVVVDSPTEVTLKLSQPDYQIPYLVAGRTGAISSPAAASDTQKLSVWPVGAGPFKITDFVAEDHAYFEKNPDYWDAENIHIDTFQLSVAPDPATLVAAVQSGSIDFATLPALQAKQAESSGLTVTVAPSLAANNASITLNKAPFDNPKVVEAFRYAFDRQAFVDVITAGLGSVTSQPFPEGNPAFNPEVEKLWSYDPERTKRLLQEAGYGPGELSLTITAQSVATNRAELAQAQLKKVGVESTIAVVPPGSSTWQSEVYIAKNPQLATDGTIGRESPVQNLLATYGSEGIMNLSGPHASPEFVAALDAVRATPIEDPQYQARLWAAVKAGVLQSPSNYLFSNPWIIVSDPALKNLNILPSQIRWEGVTVS